MGTCSSCLGRDRDRDLSDEVSYQIFVQIEGIRLPLAFNQDEHSRLIFDDPHANHYGSFSDQNAGIIQADPQEVQRETEALQKVVTQTSKYAFETSSHCTARIEDPQIPYCKQSSRS
jgi:hypothetical protein